jgi:hypothetical protein
MRHALESRVVLVSNLAADDLQAPRIANLSRITALLGDDPARKEYALHGIWQRKETG